MKKLKDCLLGIGDIMDSYENLRKLQDFLGISAEKYIPIIKEDFDEFVENVVNGELTPNHFLEPSREVRFNKEYGLYIIVSGSYLHKESKSECLTDLQDCETIPRLFNKYLEDKPFISRITDNFHYAK
jgi:hypothetical protein